MMYYPPIDPNDAEGMAYFVAAIIYSVVLIKIVYYLFTGTW